MRKYSWFLFFFVFGISAQNAEDKRILEKLCSEDFSGRGYVMQGDSLAAEFIANEFNKLGLKKVKRKYFQSFDFLVNTFPTILSLELNGAQLIPGKDFVVAPSSPSAVMRRKTLLFPNKFENIEEIFQSIGEIDIQEHVLVFDKTNFKSRDELLALRTVTAKLAEIIPVILLNEGTPIWHVSQNQFRYPVVEMNGSLFENGIVDFQVDAQMKRHRARNVIARIPAQGKAKRRIVFTAHYDHLGRMGQHTFYPGANDNASGVTLLFSIARKLLKQPKSNTEYVFIAFAGEEVGLLGSKYFVEHPLFPLESVRFLVNLDIFGGAHKSITAVNGSVYKEEFELLVKTNADVKATPEIKIRGESANSDHHWFHAAGVRCFFLYSGGNNPHYHVPWDEAKDVDLLLLDKSADLITRFVGML
jgi:hypothetical protein